MIDHATTETIVRRVQTIDIQTESVPVTQRPVYDFSEERDLFNKNRSVYEDMTQREEITLVEEGNTIEIFNLIYILEVLGKNTFWPNWPDSKS